MGALGSTRPPAARPFAAAAAFAPAALAWSEAQADARGRSASRDPLKLLAGAVGAADAAMVFALSMLASVLRNGVETGGVDLVPMQVVTSAALASLLVVNALSLAGAYTAHIRDGFVPQVGRAVQAWTVVFVLLLAIGYLTKTSSDYSRIWAVSWYASVVLGLAAVRGLAVMQLRRWRARGRLASTLAIVDLAGGGAGLARRLAAGAADIRLIGVFVPDEADGDAGGEGTRSGVAELIALSRLFRIDEVFVLVGGDTAAAARLPAILRRLGTIPTNVRLCPLLPGLDAMPIRETGLVHAIPALTVHRRPLDAWSSVVKRIEDLVIGSLALVLLGPLMLVVAILVKLDSPGPVLFRQARQGFNNNVITVLKFRSMTHREETADEPGRPVEQAKRGDRRVTRLGRILRRTSIDELPQILNVLAGEMSLVGPRPHAVVHNEQYAAVIDDYLGRHRMQPGITGWAQVNGLRGETDTLDKMQRRVEFDLQYIDNWSIALDLKIILLTAISMLFDRQAY